MNCDALKIKIHELYSANKIAGMSVAVTNKTQTLFSEGFGVESVERPVLRVMPTTLYKIASITKIITGLTIMKLVEQDKVSLDTPVIKYVPWLKLTRTEADNVVTLRHLLCHGSGLSSEIRKNGPNVYVEQREDTI